ncbi:MAG: glycine cleavage T C-terminal barrel domain-containing protein [Deinococcales bacterium]
MVKLDKPDFIGKTALLRTGEIPLDKQLVGFEMLDKTAPKEGAVIWQEGDYAGYITSSSYSPLLGKSVMLGWLRFRDGYLAEEVMIEGRKARRVNPPFYDVEGRRARA